MPISPATTYHKRYLTVHGRRMACVDSGSGEAIVFLHGNPTSSYLWRNVMPHLDGRGRLIAPDLIGMGDSDKLPDSGPDRYRFVEHRQYLDALLDALELGDAITFVVHDWGSALAFDWAHRHPHRVRGIAHMESIVTPLQWTDMPESIRPLFEGFRSDAGEEMVLTDNTFVEQVLPGSVQRSLSAIEMTEYRRPFAEPGEGRRPTLTWPREIPLDGAPADVHEIVAAYSAWLQTTTIPKLLVRAEPGAILRERTLDVARSFPNQEEVTVPGIHFVQEDAPDAVGEAVRAWLPN
ncbi:haloalkane dehalogenase [Limimonas halophila]|uniref:Haloalkane dehalogenase n=1 Tax=Limimonas halophila TaxID=1082479 RepID=A0A1G7LP86_9PROT|nr:haloalkane dehalogenase [Limimonas halophila]SDF51184.1 haloalkane dehalogenase [Limimonas halophila]